MNTFAKNILDFLTGPFGVTLMSIAVVAVGIGCVTGRMPWFWFITVIVGCVLVFSAETIVKGFSSVAGG